MKKPFLVYCTLVLFSVYSLTGCAASNQVPVTSGPKAPASKIVTVSKDEVQRAALVSLQKLGYLVTDQRTASGIITAERFSSSQFAEDDTSSVNGKAKNSSPNPFLVFLSIILIFGLIFIIIDAASNSSSEEGKNKGHDNDRDDHHYDHHDDGPEPIASYKYVMTVRFTAVSDTAAQVRPVITKITMRNGAPTDSRAVESSHLLNEFYRALEKECNAKP
jgi:hypothetical protein